MQMWRDSRIMVTGASGFFGRWLVETFHHANQVLGLGAQLVGIGSPTSDFKRECPQLLGLEDVVLIKADICHLEAEIHAQLPEWCDRIDAVIHAAIYVDARYYDQQPLPTLETAVKGTWETLELTRKAHVKRFLFISSGAVYGTQPCMLDRIAEDHSIHLNCAIHSSAYAEGKRLGETLCAAYLRQYGLPVTIARPFAFVGPHLPIDRHFAIGNFLRDALGSGPIVLQSDGSPLRSYLYAADLAVWLWTILAQGTLGQPYNVGSEHATSLLDVANLISRVSPHHNAIDIQGTSVIGPPPRYIPDTSRARQELGLGQTIDLQEGIRRTFAWHRQML